MSDINTSSRELIEKIKKYVDADGQSILSSKTIDFINDEYVKEREKIKYYVVRNVEELHFHNLTTVFNLEKLWDILHKVNVVRKGRKLKVSPIDTDVLDTLKCSINKIIEGEKQRCPDIFAFGEPAPTPDFMIGGYKIPDTITFEGVKRGRKPSALSNYSFIVSYHASKSDPMGPTESINVVNKSGSKPDNNVVKIDLSENKSINEINKYSDGPILGNNECCNLGYHIDILKKKPVVKSAVNVKPKSELPITLTSTIVYTPSINVYTSKKVEMNRCIFEPAKFSFSKFNKPSSLSGSTKTPVIIKSSVPLYNTPLVNPSPYKVPVKPIKSSKPGRREGSKNKTAEEKQEIEDNKLPRGRQLGSENIGATAKKDNEVIMWDNEIMLRVNPNLFEVHMIKYTIDNSDKSYVQWIGHAHKIINHLNDENKKISEILMKNWEKTVLSGIDEICSKLTKPSESVSRRERIMNKYKRMNSNAKNSDNFDEISNLKNSRYIDTESDNVKNAVDEMHMLLKNFKDDKIISDILRNALVQMNALDESKLNTDDVVVPVSEVEIDEVREVSEIKVVDSETSDGVSEIDRLNELSELCESSKVDENSVIYEVSEFGEISDISDMDEIDMLSDVCEVSDLGEIDEMSEVDELSDVSELCEKIDDGVSDEVIDTVEESMNVKTDAYNNYEYNTSCNSNNDTDEISDIVDIYAQYDDNSADVEDINAFNTENMIVDNIYTYIHETEIINSLIEKDDSNDRGDVGSDVSNANNSYQINTLYIEIVHDLIINMYERIRTVRSELVSYRENYVGNRSKNKNSDIVKRNKDRYFRSTLNRKRKLKGKKMRTGSDLW